MVPANKSEKMRMRLTEDIARQVRATADLDDRPIQDQLRFLVALGLQARAASVHGNVGERRRIVPQDDAQLILPAPPIAAERRKAPQRKSA